MTPDDPRGDFRDDSQLPLRLVPAIVILNPAAGSRWSAGELRSLLAAAVAELGRELRIIEPAPGQPLPPLAQEIVADAAASGAMVIAAGGDGTISTVAAACFLRNVPLGVIPTGTFNYFAREWGVPEQPVDALLAALAGVRTRVDVGFANGRLFLNNASFGLYPRLIRERESTKARLGRHRWVARLAALGSMLSGQRRFAVSMETDGLRQIRRATMVFVGNNALQLQQLGLEVAGCIMQGRLAVVVQPPLGRLQRLRQMLLGLFGRLGQEAALERGCASTLVVDSKRHQIELAIDGELCRLPPPLVFSKGRQALTVMLPVRREPE